MVRIAIASYNTVPINFPLFVQYYDTEKKSFMIMIYTIVNLVPLHLNLLPQVSVFNVHIASVNSFSMYSAFHYNSYLFPSKFNSQTIQSFEGYC